MENAITITLDFAQILLIIAGSIVAKVIYTICEVIRDRRKEKLIRAAVEAQIITDKEF